jgi:hypothetical protein
VISLFVVNSNIILLTEIIDNFSIVSHEEMPDSGLCSHCYTTILEMAQASVYTFYDEHYENVLKVVNQRCGRNGATAIPDPVEDHSEEPNDFCASGTYTTLAGDMCDTLPFRKISPRPHCS